jgi:phosphatidylinositol alpha 1,6-mannosyltransferase
VRIALVTESFWPEVNGVANSVARLREQLQARGHECLVVAPSASGEPTSDAGVVRVPAITVPMLRHRLALPWRGLTRTMAAFDPDVVHLASPTLLGAQAAEVTLRLGIPMLAVYQTDLARFAASHGLQWAATPTWRWLRAVHDRADLTLAPSHATIADLGAQGFSRVRHWPRGVDLVRFHPARRDEAVHDRLAAGRDVVVGYVGRLAAEKEIELLEPVQDLPGVRVVVVGDGPQRRALERRLPRAVFTGLLSGTELAQVVASLDVFTHTGPAETFCQAAQEALASGVPVVAPAAGGLLDLVTEGLNGILYPPGSAAELRAAVAALAADPGRRRALGRGARLSVAARSWSAVTDSYLEYCRDVLRDRTPRSAAA